MSKPVFHYDAEKGSVTVTDGETVTVFVPVLEPIKLPDMQVAFKGIENKVGLPSRLLLNTPLTESVATRAENSLRSTFVTMVNARYEAWVKKTATANAIVDEVKKAAALKAIGPNPADPEAIVTEWMEYWPSERGEGMSQEEKDLIDARRATIQTLIDNHNAAVRAGQPGRWGSAVIQPPVKVFGKVKQADIDAWYDKQVAKLVERARPDDMELVQKHYDRIVAERKALEDANKVEILPAGTPTISEIPADF